MVLSLLNDRLECLQWKPLTASPNIRFWPTHLPHEGSTREVSLKGKAQYG